VTEFRYQGTEAARYVTARYAYTFIGSAPTQALEDVIWARGREALTLRKELANLLDRLTDEIGYVRHGLYGEAGRVDGGRGDLWQPSERQDLAASVRALNDRERELEELCRAAELLGSMTIEGSV
jgi:hypothetical protein